MKKKGNRERFIKTARELGCDESEAAFNEKMKKMLTPKKEEDEAN